MSDTIATNETEQAPVETSQPDRYDTLEAAMDALGTQEDEQDVQEAEDITPEDQPEDEEETEEETEAEEGEEETEEEIDVDGDDTDGDIEVLNYDPSVVVTLEDGTESTLEELVSGNLRQADYTRKTEAIAEERRALEDIKASAQNQSEEINRTYEGLVEFLQGIMPPEPSLDLLG